MAGERCARGPAHHSLRRVKLGAPVSAETLTELDAQGWELYHVAKDFAENHDVAGENRAKLIEMIAAWYVEAGKYNVLPIDSRGTLRFADERPQIAVDRVHYTYYPETQTMPMNSAVSVVNRSHSIIADVEIPVDGAEGVLICQGGSEGGYSFYVQNNRLCYVHNYVQRDYYYVRSESPLPSGRHKLRFQFEATGEPDLARGKGTPGRGHLFIDSEPAGSADIPVTIPITMGLTAGVNIGVNSGSPITPEYRVPFIFTGKIHNLTVDVSGEIIGDAETKKESHMRMVMARQ
jgi:hypothetical protein